MDDVGQCSYLKEGTKLGDLELAIAIPLLEHGKLVGF